MKKMTLVSVLLMCVMASAKWAEDNHLDPHLNKIWEAYQAKYNKNYKFPEEVVKRRVIWEENLKHICQHNVEEDVGMHRARYHMDETTDRTPEERRKIRQEGSRANHNNGNRQPERRTRPTRRRTNSHT